MRYLRVLVVLAIVLLFIVGVPATALAQTPTPSAPVFTLSTTYPSQTIGLGEDVTLSLKLRSTYPAQIVRLEMRQVAEGWTASFRGGGRIVRLHGPYVEDGVPMDPWNRAYVYKAEASKEQPFQLYSLGADGEPGGTDYNADIGYLP